MPSLSEKTFSGMVTEGSQKAIPKDNCYRMKNMICLENKFLSRAGCKKMIDEDLPSIPIIASGGNLYAGIQSPFSARINMVYAFKRSMKGYIKQLDYPTLRAISGTPVGTAIHNVDELQAMQNDLSASYYLANDIDASATSGWNGGLGFNPVGNSTNKFTGIFDGNGYTITGLFINRPATNYVSLFGKTYYAEIKTVGMITNNITGYNHVGSLVGMNTGGTVTNCYSTGTVDGNIYVGGLIGCGDWDTETNCYSAGAVSASAGHGGGFCGDTDGHTVNDCFWDTQTSGQATSAGGTGKTTAEMKQQATFTNWDFATIWEML